jgi:hypothetical protein
MDRPNQLQFDQPVQVIEVVEQPASGAGQNGYEVHVDLVELSGSDQRVSTSIGTLELPRERHRA